MGMENGNRTVQLLSQFGFSTNVFDKDGMGPLDFQERMSSKELQNLINIHKHQEFENTQEPNPWSWSVWTRIQREKNVFKQLVSVSHPCLHTAIQAESNGHGHSHDHSHSHNHLSNSKQQLPTSVSVQNLTQQQQSNGYYSNCVLL